MRVTAGTLTRGASLPSLASLYVVQLSSEFLCLGPTVSTAASLATASSSMQAFSSGSRRGGDTGAGGIYAGGIAW